MNDTKFDGRRTQHVGILGSQWVAHSRLGAGDNGVPIAAAPSTSNAQIGSRVKQLRGEKSQGVLAESMRKRGFKWSQGTVWTVETGERPLRLSEAVALAELFGLPIEALSQPEDDMREQLLRAELAAARSEVERASSRVAEIEAELALTAPADSLCEHDDCEFCAPFRPVSPCVCHNEGEEKR